MAEKTSPILTREERLEIACKVFGTTDGVRPIMPKRGDKIQEYSVELIRAQAKKIAKWGNGPCMNEGHYRRLGTDYPVKLRRECSQCWQEAHNG